MTPAQREKQKQRASLCERLEQRRGFLTDVDAKLQQARDALSQLEHARTYVSASMDEIQSQIDEIDGIVRPPPPGFAPAIPQVPVDPETRQQKRASARANMKAQNRPATPANGQAATS